MQRSLVEAIRCICYGNIMNAWIFIFGLVWAAAWISFGEASATELHSRSSWTIRPARALAGQSIQFTYEPSAAAKNARTVYLHLGVNGWNLPLSGTGAGSETVIGNRSFFLHAAMNLAADG